MRAGKLRTCHSLSQAMCVSVCACVFVSMHGHTGVSLGKCVHRRACTVCTHVCAHLCAMWYICCASGSMLSGTCDSVCSVCTRGVVEECHCTRMRGPDQIMWTRL